MTKDQKNEVIEILKGKFSQYNNFYITDTESLSVEQISNLRRTCFNKQVEMKVAKNTLIRKALENLDSEKYAGLYESLNNVTALMFSENPKDPAVIIGEVLGMLQSPAKRVIAALLNHAENGSPKTETEVVAAAVEVAVAEAPAEVAAAPEAPAAEVAPEA
ncbi:MAG: 50S ribosomal protein L10 [Chitinophagia bacterium]|nr:50S ribosomal protein L10 [Chitinophagia bacterium]